MRQAVTWIVLAAGLVLSSGCATPAYTGGERAQLISRAWGYEWAQAQDDIDNALLLRPPSRLTAWNVR